MSTANLSPRERATVIRVLKHAADAARLKAWNAAEDARIEPTDDDLKAEVRRLNVLADEADARYRAAAHA